jgi:hypothetical protein
MVTTCTYQISYLGYIIAGPKNFLISPPKGIDETSLVASNGDVSINGQKLVENYRPLCYSVSFSEWTLTRHVGSRIITIVGPGVTSSMEWDTSIFLERPGAQSINMNSGDVLVGGHLVIECGRLHDGQSNVSEKPVEETRRASRNEWVTPHQTLGQYSIDYLGYTISNLAERVIVVLPNGADEASLDEDHRYASSDLVATNGDISINGQKLVEDYGALCYSVSVSEWTLTRNVGSRIITIDGPGGTSPMQWDASFHMRNGKLPSIHMEGGNVMVGDRLVIERGRLYDGESDVSEEPVEETRRPSQNQGVVTPLTREQIPDDTRLLPRAYEKPQRAGPTTTSYAEPDHGQRIFQLIHGVHTVDRYPHCFIYNNPDTATYNAQIDLSTSSSGPRYLFLKGSVWLDGQEVIRDGYQLPEGHPGRPQPHFDIFSD